MRNGDISMQIHDISMEIHEGMQVYKDREQNRPRLERVRRAETDGANETAFWMNLHTGTHIDAPFHMDPMGATTDAIPPGAALGPCRVLDFRGLQGGIGRAQLELHTIPEGWFVLLHTDNSSTEAFDPSFRYLARDGAEYLADRKVAGVGIDALGIERDQPGHDTHRILMERGILILEGLRLAEVPAGDYFLCALPLSIRGADGAPARAVLLPFRLWEACQSSAAGQQSEAGRPGEAGR